MSSPTLRLDETKMVFRFCWTTFGYPNGNSDVLRSRINRSLWCFTLQVPATYNFMYLDRALWIYNMTTTPPSQ